MAPPLTPPLLLQALCTIKELGDGASISEMQALHSRSALYLIKECALLPVIRLNCHVAVTVCDIACCVYKIRINFTVTSHS